MKKICIKIFFLKKNDLVIIDIGANIGLFSLHVSDKAKSIYSIEPTPSHFDILKELTQSKKNIFPMQCALNDSDKEVTLYLSQENSTMNSIANRYGQQVKVKGIKLSSLLETLSLNHVDFIKCDIEGSEVIALTEETVGEVKDKVDAWFIEIHVTDGNGVGRNRWRIREVFEKNGYTVRDYDFDGLIITK